MLGDRAVGVRQLSVLSRVQDFTSPALVM